MPIDLLKETLNAHRVALGINMQNADVLFNTAQVLTTLAEEVTATEPVEPDVKAQATSLLQEAVELFASCLARQEMDFTDLISLQDMATSTAVEDDEMVEDTSEVTEPSTEETPEQWATVIEPVTASTLLDTAIAQLRSLAVLATTVAPTESSTLATISELANSLVLHKLPYYTSLVPEVVHEEKDTPSTPFLSVSNSTSSFHSNKSAKQQPSNPKSEAIVDANLAVAEFAVSMAEAEFTSNLIDISAYHSKVTASYGPHVPLQSADSTATEGPRVLFDYANALLSFSDTLEEVDHTLAPQYRWQALTLADSLLARAIKAIQSSHAAMPDGCSIPKLYLQRGDIELQRVRVASLPSSSTEISKDISTLLKNAGIFYRGARGFAESEGDHKIAAEAGIKAGVVLVIEQARGGTAPGMKEVVDKYTVDLVRSVVGDMTADGLIDEQVLAILNKL
jgi:uncharacterized membrane protein YebE (DUF533 family)